MTSRTGFATLESMPSNRALLRSFNPNRKRPRTCPTCGTTTYVTKKGLWQRHFMPPMQTGYDIPLRHGPVCNTCAWYPGGEVALGLRSNYQFLGK